MTMCMVVVCERHYSHRTSFKCSIDDSILGTIAAAVVVVLVAGATAVHAKKESDFKFQ